jgi:hypothetical protein
LRIQGTLCVLLGLCRQGILSRLLGLCRQGILSILLGLRRQGILRMRLTLGVQRGLGIWLALGIQASLTLLRRLLTGGCRHHRGGRHTYLTAAIGAKLQALIHLTATVLAVNRTCHTIPPA